MSFAYPEMSTRGWLTDPNKVALAAFEDYLITMPSQHEQSDVQSFNRDLKETTNNMEFLSDVVQQSLVAKFSNYFNLVDVSCRMYKAKNYEDTGQFTLEMNVRFTDGGQGYSLGRAVAVSDGKVVNVKAFAQ